MIHPFRSLLPASSKVQMRIKFPVLGKTVIQSVMQNLPTCWPGLLSHLAGTLFCAKSDPLWQSGLSANPVRNLWWRQVRWHGLCDVRLSAPAVPSTEMGPPDLTCPAICDLGTRGSYSLALMLTPDVGARTKWPVFWGFLKGDARGS